MSSKPDDKQDKYHLLVATRDGKYFNVPSSAIEVPEHQVDKEQLDERFAKLIEMEVRTAHIPYDATWFGTYLVNLTTFSGGVDE